MTGQLANALRLGTRDLHTMAERTGLMRDMLRGRVERETYCRLLRSLYAIYEELEAGLDRHAGHELISLIQLPGLARGDSLAADLEYLHGPDWKPEIAPAAAAAAYAAHLRTLNLHDPLLLVAHSYVRYLGDLSGGQLLSRVVAEALRLPGKAGMQFYLFAEPGASALAATYRQGLMSMPLDAVTEARIVAEARLAFGWHCNLFNELASPAASATTTS
jgi:heme oxygenase